MKTTTDKQMTQMKELNINDLRRMRQGDVMTAVIPLKRLASIRSQATRMKEEGYEFSIRKTVTDDLYVVERLKGGAR